MAIYKTLSSDALSVNRIKLHKSFSLITGSAGINSVQYRSGSDTISGSYYKSLRVNYYLSGSDLAINQDVHTFGYHNQTNPQHRNKFYSSGSVISISQKLFGEEIKPNSFELRDKSNSFNKTVIIKDDGKGNLYSSNAVHSQSNATSISSSDNYIGNIFYNTGLVVLTETGSWSGSVNYTDVSTENYTTDFKSTHTLYIQEYDISVNGTELNGSNNPTSKSGSNNPSVQTDFGQVEPQLTASGWSPYITTVGLYDDEDELVVVGRLSQPVKKINWGTLSFKLRFDI
tara:strand:- start:247 stop:1104 length:858 start_codon:yes stop_codon:yes gene_type:complete